METFSMYFDLSSILFFIMQLIILRACFVISQKRVSMATKLLLTGAILNVIINASRYFINEMMAFSGQDDMMLIHVALSYLSNIAYGIFAFGLIQFALNDLTEGNNDDDFRRGDDSRRRDDRRRDDHRRDNTFRRR